MVVWLLPSCRPAKGEKEKQGGEGVEKRRRMRCPLYFSILLFNPSLTFASVLEKKLLPDWAASLALPFSASQLLPLIKSSTCLLQDCCHYVWIQLILLKAHFSSTLSFQPKLNTYTSDREEKKILRRCWRKFDEITNKWQWPTWLQAAVIGTTQQGAVWLCSLPFMTGRKFAVNCGGVFKSVKM